MIHEIWAVLGVLSLVVRLLFPWVLPRTFIMCLKKQNLLNELCGWQELWLPQGEIYTFKVTCVWVVYWERWSWCLAKTHLVMNRLVFLRTYWVLSSDIDCALSQSRFLRRLLVMVLFWKENVESHWFHTPRRKAFWILDFPPRVWRASRSLPATSPSVFQPQRVLLIQGFTHGELGEGRCLC